MRSHAIAFACALAGALAAQDVALVPFGSTWKYLDNGSNQATAWRAAAFNDASWASGPAELGYGDGDEATTVSYGSNASAKYITTYFRKTFNIPSVNAYAGFRMRVKRDDGVKVYINGTEALRQNFDENAVSYTTLATQAVATTEEWQVLELVLLPSQFVDGNNTIAAEVHQNVATSSDLSFDLELIGLDANPGVHRGPYLQAARPTGITVCWFTDVPSSTRVRYGPSPAELTFTYEVANPVMQHEAVITGLQPGTTYYYAIGTSSQDLAGGDATHFFKTSPEQGSPQPLRIWVTGDSGTGTVAQLAVRNSYNNFIASSPKADVWLMLGDNVYVHGRETEYYLAMFRNMYEGILRNTTLWPSPGNHDYYVSDMNGLTNTGPYYRIFAPPKLGQCGGVASNTEAYYSYDVGNVHFIALDSYGVSRAANGAMASWLQNDLAYAKANAKWTIAYWHFPPYSKGGHDSDDPGYTTEMRANFNPILEQGGTDLVLVGHSHSYERSYLIDGHYGLSTTFNSTTMGVDMSSGRSGAPHAYMKPADPTPHAGTVYTVCGVAGRKEGGALNHPVMYMSTGDHYGSMIVDVNGDSLHARFINDAGAELDHFDMVKPASRVKVAMKVFLEGAFDQATVSMRDDLRAAALIPATEPYSGIFSQIGSGGETVDPAVLATTGNSAVVDWVFLQLRSKADPALVIATRSALVRRDGQVVDLDGLSPVGFHVPVGDYYVAVRHRNHLSAMTAAPVHLNYQALPIDLTQAATLTWGTEARRNVNGNMVLWAGEVLHDGVVRYVGFNNDRDPILFRIGGTEPTQTDTGYDPTDTSMDGVIRYVGQNNDRDPILSVIGGSVPTEVRYEQLP